MSKKRSFLKKRGTFLTETITSFLALVFSIRILNTTDPMKLSTRFSFAAMLFFWAVTEVTRTVQRRENGKLYIGRMSVAAAAYFIGSIAVVAFGSYLSGVRVAAILFFFVLMQSRVLKLIHKHGVLRIIIAVILIALASLLLLSSIFINSDTESDTIFTLMILPTFYCMILMLVRIIGMSVSGVKLDLIKQIAHTTMAGQILSGLLILVLTFSVVFESQEKQITSYTDALWYCFAIITTIGFGDITAETGIGRTLSVILGAYGIIVVALITSIIVNFYNELKSERVEEERAAKEKEALEKKNEEDRAEWYGDYI